MGWPEPGRHTLADQYAYQAYCWAYQKSSCNDSFRLHLRSLHTSHSKRKHDITPITSISRVSPTQSLGTCMEQANSPLFRSAHPATPKFSYPEYGVMMAPVPMPLQSFLPMMPDPLASPMQYFPPSPVMNGTIYESHWNMMPGYQMSPPQHMHPPSEEYPAPNHHPYHPRTKGIDPNSPSFYPDRRGLTLENLHTATTSADLQLLVQAAGTVQHCSILAPDPASNNGQARGLITMQTAEDAQRAVTMFNNMSFMGSRIRVKVNRGSHIKRNKSFDGVPSSGPGTHYSMISGVKSVNRQTCRSWADEMTAQAKAGDSCKPLVIDGSGLNKSVDIMSTPAPT